MALTVHPARAPAAGVALGYLLVADFAVLAAAVLLATLPGVVPDLLLPLPLVHLLALGVGVSTLLGVGRHLALTLLAADPVRTRPVPLLHVGAVALLVVGFVAGAFPAVAAGGALVAGEVAFVAVELGFALRRRRQLGAVHAFLALAYAALLATAVVGIREALLLAAGRAPAPGTLLTHVALGAAGTFAVAVMGTSLQLVPMFSAARPLPPGRYWSFFGLAVLACGLGVGGADRGTAAAVLPFLALWAAWVALLWERLGSGRPKPAEPFFLFGRAGELALGATGFLILAGVGLPVVEAVYFLGFLLPTLFAYLSRIVPFLLWLRLTQTYGYDRSIPKVGNYVPRWLGLTVPPYLLGLLAYLALPGGATAGRLLVAAAAAAYGLGLLRGFVVGLRFVPRPPAPPPGTGETPR